MSPSLPVHHVVLAVALACAAGCAASSGPATRGTVGTGPRVLPDIPITQPPFDQVQANWKERLAQPYVFLEGRGSYTGIGRLLERVTALARDQGLQVSGPPFGLFYDDPGLVPVDQLRLRACLPVSHAGDLRAPLSAEVLEGGTVVYAFVAGPYPEVPRAYPGMFAFLADMGWRENGPIREIYLVNPSEVEDFAELVTEVQIPAVSAR